MMRQPNPKLGLGFLVDLYIRFREYHFLEGLLVRIMDMPLNYTDRSGRIVDMDEYKFRLLLYYTKKVDLNIEVAKTTTQTERFVRILNLMNSQALNEHTVLFYVVVDSIYSFLVISQYEKPLQTEKRARSGSFKDELPGNEMFDFDENELAFSDCGSKIKWQGPFDQRLSFDIDTARLDLNPFSAVKKEKKKKDVFLSILLGKIMVKFKDIKLRLASLNIQESEAEMKIKEQIFEMIDFHTVINEIIELGKNETLIEMSAADFYQFFPFIEQYQHEDESFENECEESIPNFISTLFPVLTTTSQINLLNSGLADRL